MWGVVLSAAAVVLLAALLTLLFAGGVFVSPKYLEPWQKTYAQKFKDPRLQVTAHGILAANGHNMQPWKIQLDAHDPMVFYLYADSTRMTPVIDPLARQMMVTQGAFLEYVRTAGEKLGYQTDIVLFPNGNYDENHLKASMDEKPVAKVTLSKQAPAANARYAAMFLPDTNREPYLTNNLTDTQIDAMKQLNTDPTQTLVFYQDAANRKALGDYAKRAATIEAKLPSAMRESNVIFRANEYQKNQYRYGYSVEGQGTSGVMLYLLEGLVTLFPSLNEGTAATNTMIDATETAVDHTPAYALVISKDNSRASQVRSGMLYSALVLQAHVEGLAMQPLSQALEEYPQMKKEYENIHRQYAPDGGTIQMLVRIGKPSKGTPVSMRRDVMDFVMKKSLPTK